MKHKEYSCFHIGVLHDIINIILCLVSCIKMSQKQKKPEQHQCKLAKILQVSGTLLGGWNTIVVINCVSAVTNPISINVGNGCTKNAIKTKKCNLLNHLNIYLTDKSTEKIFSVFPLTNLIVFCKYKKQQNVTPATH